MPPRSTDRFRKREINSRQAFPANFPARNGAFRYPEPTNSDDPSAPFPPVYNTFFSSHTNLHLQPRFPSVLPGRCATFLGSPARALGPRAAAGHQPPARGAPHAGPRGAASAPEPPAPPCRRDGIAPAKLPGPSPASPGRIAPRRPGLAQPPAASPPRPGARYLAGAAGAAGLRDSPLTFLASGDEAAAAAGRDSALALLQAASPPREAEAPGAAASSPEASASALPLSPSARDLEKKL